MYAKAAAAEEEHKIRASNVPHEAKEMIFDKMVKRGFARDEDFEGAEFWEVRPGDYGYDTDMAVDYAGKRYYGEI